MSFHLIVFLFEDLKEPSGLRNHSENDPPPAFGPSPFLGSPTHVTSPIIIFMSLEVFFLSSEKRRSYWQVLPLVEKLMVGSSFCCLLRVSLRFVKSFSWCILHITLKSVEAGTPAHHTSFKPHSLMVWTSAKFTKCTYTHEAVLFRDV